MTRRAASRTTFTVDRSLFSTCTGTSVIENAVALGDDEHLDVEGEPVDPAALEDGPGGVGPERLQAALGVAVGAEDDGVGEEVDDPAADLPQPAGLHEGGGLVVAAAADDDVPAGLDLLEQAEDLVGGVGQVGVGEGDGAAAGGQDAGPHRRALAPVAGLDDDLVGAGRGGGLGGAVGRPVVDHHQPPRGPTSRQGPADGGDGGGDAVALVVGGDDDRQADVAFRGAGAPMRRTWPSLTMWNSIRRCMAQRAVPATATAGSLAARPSGCRCRR